MTDSRKPQNAEATFAARTGLRHYGFMQGLFLAGGGILLLATFIGAGVAQSRPLRPGDGEVIGLMSAVLLAMIIGGSVLFIRCRHRNVLVHVGQGQIRLSVNGEDARVLGIARHLNVGVLIDAEVRGRTRTIGVIPAWRNRRAVIEALKVAAQASQLQQASRFSQRRSPSSP